MPPNQITAKGMASSQSAFFLGAVEEEKQRDGECAGGEIGEQAGHQRGVEAVHAWDRDEPPDHKVDVPV